MQTGASYFHIDLSSAKDPIPTAFDFLTELLPARDLTAEALRAGSSPTTFVPRDGLDRDEPEPLFDRMARILHRARNRHLVLLGRKGTGKTAAIRELARLAALGAYSSLQNKTFLFAPGRLCVKSQISLDGPAYQSHHRAPTDPSRTQHRISLTNG